MYDYVIVGAGLFGSVFAYEMKKRGKKCLIIEKRNHIGGNIYTEKKEDIPIHVYGAHIFHTKKSEIWDYMNQFAEFNHFKNAPLANYQGEIYNLPFNMNTFYQMWGKSNPGDVKAIIDKQRKEIKEEPKNLEEQAIQLVGRDVYEKLIKGYTEKQWGRSCLELPPFIIKRLPVRLTYNNNYFNDPYQGIPVGGYTPIIEKMLEGCDVLLNTDYLNERKKWNALGNQVIFTGPIDAYFNYNLGKLKYRSIRFETEILETENYQGNAVVNFTDAETPYTRIIEHKHFEFGQQEKTVISKEYSEEWSVDKEPYYPINNTENSKLYEEYRQLTLSESGVSFGGRLAEYRYYDMDQVIASALQLVKVHVSNKS